MAVIISDSFNRGADSTTSLGTADSGQTYVVGGSATYGIIGNQGYAATSTQDNTGAYIVIGTGVRNYTAQISVPTMQTSGVNFFRFYVRALMGGLLAYVAVEAHSSGYRVTKRDTGGTTTVIATSGKVPANGDVIKVDHFDTGLMDVYINGTKYMSVTDATILASAYGVGFGGKQAPTYRVDDFSVVDLATGGGTVGSVSYATKQSIYQTSSVALATKQIINQSGATALATKQVIAQTASILAATKQTIYQVGSISYATQQTITDGGIPGSIGYRTKQIIYQTSSAQMATKQAIYQNGTVSMASKQVIYCIGVDPIATKQIVFNVGTNPISTKQIIYAIGSAAYATKQTIFDPQQQIIGTVELKASRELNVYLLASRDLYVNLKGALPVAEENQNISMYASESKIVEFTATDSNTGAALNLTGAAVKWAMRRSNSKTNDLVKDSNSGIALTNAAAGKFTVTLTPTDTVNLSGDFVYQAEVIDASGFENVVVTGRVAIGKNINK